MGGAIRPPPGSNDHVLAMMILIALTRLNVSNGRPFICLKSIRSQSDGDRWPPWSPRLSRRSSLLDS